MSDVVGQQVIWVLFYLNQVLIVPYKSYYIIIKSITTFCMSLCFHNYYATFIVVNELHLFPPGLNMRLVFGHSYQDQEKHNEMQVWIHTEHTAIRMRMDQLDQHTWSLCQMYNDTLNNLLYFELWAGHTLFFSWTGGHMTNENTEVDPSPLRVNASAFSVDSESTLNILIWVQPLSGGHPNP